MPRIPPPSVMLSEVATAEDSGGKAFEVRHPRPPRPEPPEAPAPSPAVDLEEEEPPPLLARVAAMIGGALLAVVVLSVLVLVAAALLNGPRLLEGMRQGAAPAGGGEVVEPGDARGTAHPSGGGSVEPSSPVPGVTSEGEPVGGAVDVERGAPAGGGAEPARPDPTGAVTGGGVAAAGAGPAVPVRVSFPGDRPQWVRIVNAAGEEVGRGTTALDTSLTPDAYTLYVKLVGRPEAGGGFVVPVEGLALACQAAEASRIRCGEGTQSFVLEQ